MYLKICVGVALVFLITLPYTQSSSAAVNSIEELEHFTNELDDGPRHISKRTIVFRPLFVYREQQKHLVHNHNTDGAHIDKQSNGVQHRAKRTVVFRPLFVYRQQQKKLINRKKSTDRCIETLKGMGHVEPFQPHFHKCKTSPTPQPNRV